MPSLRLALVAPAVLVALLAAACSESEPVAIEPSAAIEQTPFDAAPQATEGAAAQPGVATPTTPATATAELVADPTPTVAAARTRGQQSASGQIGPYETIADVDFENDFTYRTGFDENQLVTVVDGFAEVGERDDGDYIQLTVTDVDRGDLDGDGRDEAVVTTAWSGGGTGWFSAIHTFRLVEGAVIAAGIVPFGDRGDGGIFDVELRGGLVTVWSFSSTQGACCPDQVGKHLLALGTESLVEAESAPSRTWMSLDASDGPRPLSFLPTTSSAMVVLPAHESEGHFTLDAGQGQLVTVVAMSGPPPESIVVTDTATRQTIADSSGALSLALPATGVYDIGIVYRDERALRTLFDVAVDRAEPSSGVTWTPAVDQLTITAEPLVQTSVVRPVLSSSQPGTAAANELIAAFTAALTEPWIEDVTVFSEPQDDSTFELRYEVTLVAADLVSVRFDFYDYVCCRPYPNYGQHAIVLDLATGTVVPIDQIIDIARIDELHDLWLAELVRQDEYFADVADLFAGRPVTFDSLGLVAGGVEFGTDRGSLAGGLPGTRTVLTFEQLGDLVRAEVLRRAG